MGEDQHKIDSDFSWSSLQNKSVARYSVAEL